MNVNKQVKNSAIYIVSVIIRGFIPFITLPILTTVLTKEDYGVYGLAQIYAIFMSSLANFGLPLIFERNYFLYKNKNERYELLYTCLFFVLIIFSIMLVITSLFSSYISYFMIGSYMYNEIILVTFCAVSVANFKIYFLIHFKNSENAKSYTYYEFIENLSIAILSIIFVLKFSTGVVGLAYAQLICSFTIFLKLFISYARESTMKMNLAKLKEVLKISYPLTPRLFIGIINNHFDKYMINLMKTTGGVGLYSIAQRFANILFTFMTALQNVFSPQVYKLMFEDKSTNRKKIAEYLIPFLYVTILMALIISLFCEEVVIVFYKKAFYDMIDLIIILSMYMSLMFFGKIPQLLYKKKTFIISILTLSSVCINVSLNFIFIFKWGVVGAAYATLISGLISITIHMFVSQYYYHILWQYRKIFIIYLIYFSACFFLLVCKQMNISYDVRLIIKVLSLLLYFIIGIFFKIITKDKLKLVKNIVFVKFKT